MQLIPVVGVNNSLAGNNWFAERHLARAQGLFDPSLPPPDVTVNLSRTYHEFKSEYELWHPRLAHINPRMALLAKPDLKDWPRKSHCDDCTMGKFHKLPHSGKRPTAANLPWAPGEYLTCDLFGPLLRSAGGAKYAAFYIDLKSRFVYVKALKHKSDHYRSFVEVVVDVRARSGRPMRFFKTDGDGIFTGGEAVELYEKYNIRHVQSAPGDSASNDVAERTIRTFAELTRSNLLHAGAPPNLWAEAMALVGYVWNHIATMPSTTIPGSYLSHTSILEGHSRKFDLSNLRAFGTKCYFMLTVQKKGGRKEAVGAKAKLGAIVGIEDNMPAYRVFDFEQRDKPKKIPFAQVVTHEGHFPFRSYAQWTVEEKELPESFIPTVESYNNYSEWRRFQFQSEDMRELESGNSNQPEVQPDIPPLGGLSNMPPLEACEEFQSETDVSGATGPLAAPPVSPLQPTDDSKSGSVPQYRHPPQPSMPSPAKVTVQPAGPSMAPAQDKAYDLRPSKDPVYKPPRQLYRKWPTVTQPVSTTSPVRTTLYQ